MRVLVVDQPIIASGLMAMFQSEHEIGLCCARDIRSGLSMFLRHQPHVTITELSLPDGSGLELTQKILQIDSRARIILLSMSDDPVVAARAIEAGAHAYFTKAGAPCLLLEAVMQLAATIPQTLPVKETE